MQWYEYAVILFGTGFIGIIIQLVISDRISIKASQLAKQKEVYNNFLFQWQLVARPANRDQTFDLIVARNTALLYASTRTATLINKYANCLITNAITSREQVDEHFSEIIKSMRKDLKLKNKLYLKRAEIQDMHFIVSS